MASLPAWNEIGFSNGASWLNSPNVPATSLQSYRQVLDMRTGSMRTSYDWADGDKKLRSMLRSSCRRPTNIWA